MDIQEPISIKSFNNRDKLKTSFLDEFNSYLDSTTNNYSDDIYNISVGEIFKNLSGKTDILKNIDKSNSSNPIVIDKEDLVIDHISFYNSMFSAYKDNTVEIYCNKLLIELFASLVINDVNAISSINSISYNKDGSIEYTVDSTSTIDMFSTNNIYKLLDRYNTTIKDLSKHVNVDKKDYFKIPIDHGIANDEVIYNIIIQYLLSLYSLKDKYHINLNSIGIDDLVFKPANRDKSYYRKHIFDKSFSDYSLINNNSILLCSSNRYNTNGNYFHGQGFIYYTIDNKHYRVPNYGFIVELESVENQISYLSNCSGFKVSYKNKVLHFKDINIFNEKFTLSQVFVKNITNNWFNFGDKLNPLNKEFYLGTEFNANVYRELLEKMLLSSVVNYSWDLGYFMNSIRLTPKYNIFSHELYTYYEDLSRLLLVMSFGNSNEWDEKNKVIQASFSDSFVGLLPNTWVNDTKKILCMPKISYMTQIDEFIEYLSKYSIHSGNISYRVFMNFCSKYSSLTKDLLELKKGKRNKKTLKLKTELHDEFYDIFSKKLNRGSIVDFYKNPKTICPGELDLLPDTAEDAKKSPYRIAGGAQGQIYDVNVYEDDYNINEVYEVNGDDEIDINGFVIQLLPYINDKLLEHVFIKIDSEMYNVKVADISTHRVKFNSDNIEIKVHILEPHKLNTDFFTKKNKKETIKLEISYTDNSIKEPKYINLALKKFPPVYADKFQQMNCDIIDNNIVQCNETTNEMLIAYLLNMYYDTGKIPHFLQYHKLMACSASIKNSDIAKFKKLKDILKKKNLRLSQFKLDDAFDIKKYQKINYYCLMEKIDGDLYSFRSIVDKLQYIQFISCGNQNTGNYYTKQHYINNCLMQIFYTLYFYQKELKGMHNDLHPGNIFIKLCDDTKYIGDDGKLTSLNEIKYFKYKFSDNLTFKLPNMGFIVKLGDPGHASVQVKIDGKDVIFRKNTGIANDSLAQAIAQDEQSKSLLGSIPVIGRVLQGVAVSSYERNSLNRIYDETLDLANLMNSLASHPYFFDNLLVKEYIEVEKLLYLKNNVDITNFNSSVEFNISKKYTPEFINKPSLYYPTVDRYVTPKLMLANPYISYYLGVFNYNLDKKFIYNIDNIEKTIFNQNNRLKLCILNSGVKLTGLDEIVDDNICIIDDRNSVKKLNASVYDTSSINRDFFNYINNC